MEDPDDIHQGDTDNDNVNAQQPSVVQEEDHFSNEMQEEPVDITDEMGKIGKDIDPEHPKPLGED